MQQNTVYIKELFSSRTEFAVNGVFNVNEFTDGDIFLVLGNPQSQNLPEPSFPAYGSIPSIPQLNVQPPQLPAQISRRRSTLFTVKVIRADVDQSTGKPVNFLRYNMLINVPIYTENEANVNHILEYVKNNMNNDDVILVQSNGLVYRDEEGTRGKRRYFIVL